VKSWDILSDLGKCTIVAGESPDIWIKKQGWTNHVFLTDENIYRLHRRIFSEKPTIVIGPGEEKKNLNTIQRIYKQLLDLEADRTTIITGVGGGVICDITGFAASSYMRGLRFNLVPTSLLAQADACIGGKNGVNLHHFKNIIGTFSQPKHVLLDFNLLQTLPQREIASGTAEIVKHALIDRPDFFAYLEKNLSGLTSLDPDVIEFAVLESIRIKSGIVRTDARENGSRRILNFGHTCGHAVERIREFSHGEAVSVGMAAAAEISANRGLLAGKEKNRIFSLLRRLNLPTRIPLTRSALIEAVKKDKKRKRECIHFVFLCGIGKPCVEKISYTTLEEYLHDLCEPERKKC